MSKTVYLDHQATTPCDPGVVEAMEPYWTQEFGNAASRTHAFGWRAEEAVSEARAAVAELIGASARDVIFTSGATESNNLALLGAARALRGHGDHVITCATEHRSVLDPCDALARDGFRVTRLPVRPDGRLTPDDVGAALESGTVLVSIMHANNEIGVIQPIAEIARVLVEHRAVFHTDAAQSVGKIPVDVNELGVDLLSLSGHKLYGPKGIGALYVRRRRPRLRLEPLVYGGGHERGLRSGTLPVPLCVGLGEACRVAASRYPSDAQRVGSLRRRLWQRLAAGLEDVYLNGDAEHRLPGNLNVAFVGVEAQALIVSLPDVAVSSGSACTSAKPEPSHVLRALGVDQARALGSLRFGIGRSNTAEEIDASADRVIAAVTQLRAISPVWEDARARGRSRR